MRLIYLMYRLVLLNTLAAHYSRTRPLRKGVWEVFLHLWSACAQQGGGAANAPPGRALNQL